MEEPFAVAPLTLISAAPPGMGQATAASSTDIDHSSSVVLLPAGSRLKASTSDGVQASRAVVADAACSLVSTRRPATWDAPQRIDSAVKIPSLNTMRPAARTSVMVRPASTASTEGAGPADRGRRATTFAMRGTHPSRPRRRRRSRGAAMAVMLASDAATRTTSVPPPRANPVQRWPPALSTSSRSNSRSISLRADVHPTSTRMQHSCVHSTSAGCAGVWKVSAAAAFRAALWTSSVVPSSRARRTARAASRKARTASVGATASKSASRFSSLPFRRGNWARRRGGATARA